MAQMARRVHSVDWHKGDSGAGFGDTLAEFQANIWYFGVQAKVCVQRNRIEDIGFPPDWFDLVFVDDDHSQECVEISTRLALSCVRKGGVIAWHDWPYASVQAGVKACGLEPTGFADKLAWVTA